MSAEVATIPDDILRDAESALDNMCCNCVESCGGPEGFRKASIEEIAKVILAERERAALAMSTAIKTAPAGSCRETFTLRAYRAILAPSEEA